MLTAVLRGRALQVGAVLLVLWVCGPCGPLIDRFFVERLPDHGHLYTAGHHLHGFQLAYTGTLPARLSPALGPDGAVMAELKAAPSAALGAFQLLIVPAVILPAMLRPVRVRTEVFGPPAEALVLLADPPPRPRSAG